MPQRKALPGKDSELRRPMDRALDTLTDPDVGTSGNRETSEGRRGASGAPGPAVVRGNSDTQDDSDTADSSVVRGNSGTSGTKQKPALREHVKLRGDLAAEVRDAVWFLSEHGRPRVQLGELFDEAVEAWLTDAKKQHNEGRDFPHRGRLR